jgi:hypothetical protein
MLSPLAVSVMVPILLSRQMPISTPSADLMAVKFSAAHRARLHALRVIPTADEAVRLQSLFFGQVPLKNLEGARFK